MGIKKGIKLREVKEMPREVVALMEGISMNTVEEFISYYAADKGGLTKYLGLDLDETVFLIEVASRYIDELTVRKILEFQPKRRHLGAISPYPKKIQDHLIKRRTDD